MIEVFVFNPDCLYGMGMLARFMGEVVQHKWIRFRTVEFRNKTYIVVALSTSMSGDEYSDDEGIEVHLHI